MTVKHHKTDIKIGARYLTPLVIGQTGMTALDCIAELVANSLDWNITRLDQDATTKIVIEQGKDLNSQQNLYLEIVDNGEGMNFIQLDKAIDLAEDSNMYRDRLENDQRKGMFGMGLKNSALTLGWKFTITTISKDNTNTECRFEYDSRLGLEDPDYINNLEILEYPKNSDSVLKDFDHGTSIKIEDLEREIPALNIIKTDIEERFFYDIENLKNTNSLDFIIKDNADLAIVVEKYNIDSKFKDEVMKSDFESPNKWMSKKEYKYKGKDGKTYQLKGYLQLLKKRSFVEQNYGMHLYYEGQLIERYHKGKLFPNKGRAGELTFGVLHLDGCNPDQNKSRGFVEDDIFENVLDLIEDDFKVYKYLGIATSQAKTRIKNEINKRKGLGSEHGDSFNDTDILEEEESLDQNDNQNNNTDDVSNDYPEGTIKIANNLYICVNKAWIFKQGLEKNKLSWEPLYNNNTNIENLHELQVYIDEKSNLYKSINTNYENRGDQAKIKSFFTKVAICESINQKLISEHGYNPEDARKITDNKVYPEVLKMKLD